MVKVRNDGLQTLCPKSSKFSLSHFQHISESGLFSNCPLFQKFFVASGDTKRLKD